MKKNIDTAIVCYNAPVSVYENYSGKPKKINEGILDDMSETALLGEIDNVATALGKVFSKVEVVPITKNIFENISLLKKIPDSFAFNLVESVDGVAEYEVYHAGLYDLLKLSYTGNKPQCLGNCLNKMRAKQILRAHGIKVPRAAILDSISDISVADSLRYPLITKLLKEDASIGISESSVVRDKAELHRQLEFLFSTYRQTVIIEEFIEGREFNIAILGGVPLPVSEISFEGLPDSLPRIVTYEGKWMSESLYYTHTVPICPALISNELSNRLQSIAISAYTAMDCRDYARVDTRVDSSGTPYVIEVNPNPDISSDAGLVRAASMVGITYDALIEKIARFAIERIYQAA